jgi:putative intracellular protease/amidase
MKNRILIIVTNQERYVTNNEPTGLWLSELTHAYEIFDQAGFEMDIVSPQGGQVPLDPRSLSTLFLDKSAKQFYEDQAFMQKLENTPSVNDVNWEDYDAIYYTGGHGPMWDFADNEKLQEINRNIYEHGGVVSAVCHGSCGLLNTKLSDGSYLISDKEVTGYSWIEERAAMMTKHVPFNLEEEMRKRGARYKKGIIPLRSHVVVDGRLVSGQNPASAKETARATIETIRQHLQS